MKIIDIIGKVMVNLDEVTSSNLIANSSEYIDKIYPLIDTIQTEISTIVKPIENYLTLESINKRIDVPEDCFEFKKVYNTNMSPIKFLLHNKRIFLEEDGTYVLYYNKYPNKIDKDTPNDTELEIDQDCQEALIYGVCAGICINDEPELYDTYLDRYNTLLANIATRIQNNPTARVVGGLRL